MKNTLKMILFFLILIPTLVFSEIKVGYVLVEKILKEAPQTATSNKKLEKEFMPRTQKLKKQVTSLQAQEKDFKKNNATMSKEVRESTLRTIQSAKIDIQRVERELREDIDLRRRAEIGVLQKKINIAIEKVATDKGYDLIFYQGVAYANKTVDITDVIISALKPKK